MNWSDRIWVELALISYLIGFGYSVYSLATNKFLTPRISFLGDLRWISVHDRIPF